MHLTQLMRRQREIAALEHWELPRVVVFLCERILFNDGHLCEGILRQSGSASEVAAVRNALNAGRNPPTIQNAHVYATLLKQVCFFFLNETFQFYFLTNGFLFF